MKKIEQTALFSFIKISLSEHPQMAPLILFIIIKLNYEIPFSASVEMMLEVQIHWRPIAVGTAQHR